MALSDYIPNVFGQAAPSYLQGLLGADETQNLQNRANVQGLLGAGLALAQGMSRTGPRRSAAENILGALGGGFGAAGGAYEQGVKNYVTQQQIAQTQLGQQDALLKRQQTIARIRAIEQASKDNPGLAQLFAINPEKASELLLSQERAKRYQSLLGDAPPPVNSQTVSTVDQANVVPVGNVNQAMPPNAGANTVNQQFNALNDASISTASGQVNQNIRLVNPDNVKKANKLRNAARQAIIDGDTATATFFNTEADRIDPKEQLFFRDDKLISSKFGIIADFSGGKILTDEQAIALGLDPNRGKWTYKGGIPSLVAGTEGKTRLLTPKEITDKALDPNKVYQVTPNGDISVVTDVGSVANKADLIKVLPAQFTNVYKTLTPRVDALIARASTMTRDQIVAESENILNADADIRKELDPTLAAADLRKRAAGATKINLNDPVKKAQALSQNSTNYIQNKNVSESFEVANRFNNFVSAYNNPAARGASDAFLIYSVAKILDPGGAVQQGDIETIAGKKSLPEQLRGIHDKFITTRTLSDEQRQDLNTLAYSAMNNKRKSLNPTIKQYRNYAASFESPDPAIDIQDPFDSIQLPKDRIVTINGKRTTVKLGEDPNGVKGYYYTAPNGKTYPYQD